MNSAIVDSLQNALNLQLDEITPATSQENTPSWDSLGHLKLILELEQSLGIRFRFQDIPTMTSVARIQEVVENMKK